MSYERQHERHQRFRGYPGPNYTPVPDELFDEQLPDLSGAELKVLLYVIRRTFGFKRESDTSASRRCSTACARATGGDSTVGSG